MDVALGRVRWAAEAILHGNLDVVAANVVARQRGHPRVLLKHPIPGRQTHAARRINLLLAGLSHAEHYLEIGLWRGATLESVQAAVRWGVDPNPRFDLHRLPPGVKVAVCTSDEFFADPPSSDLRFDVVYVDGLHRFRQAYRDLINSFHVCPNGVILMDDIVPVDEISAIPDLDAALQAHAQLGLTRASHIWQGDVFRVLLCVRSCHPELDFRTIEGPGDPQVVVWKRPGATVILEAGESSLRSIESIEFRDVFGEGIPSYFLPMSEESALAEALHGCRAGRSNPSNR